MARTETLPTQNMPRFRMQLCESTKTSPNRKESPRSRTEAAGKAPSDQANTSSAETESSAEDAQWSGWLHRRVLEKVGGRENNAGPRQDLEMSSMPVAAAGTIHRRAKESKTRK